MAASFASKAAPAAAAPGAGVGGNSSISNSDKPQRIDSLSVLTLEQLLGPDDENTDAEEAVEACLHVTGGDLTFGEEVHVDELKLDGLREELERFRGQDVVASILDKGADLREFSRDVEEKLRQVELESIQDYMKESDNLLSLHEQIKECDAVLVHMESLLSGFQADLGAVSAEIKDLQERSMGMGVKLRNRKGAEVRLGRFVEEMALSPDLITSIVDGEVNEAYIKSLQALNRKLHFVAEDGSARTSRALKDVQPELDRLRIKAVIKAREYLMHRIYALRKPKTNIHILQQTVLLKYKYLAIFLKEHGRVVYTEILNAYTDIMGKVLALHLRTYIAALEKLQLDIVSRNDVIGAVDDAGKQQQQLLGMNMPSLAGGIFSSQRAPRDLKNRSAVFSLGDRDAILQDVEESAIIPHIAESGGHKFPYEVLFRSLHKLLIDTATSEYVFCTEFFGDESTFYSVFAGPLAVMDEHFSLILPNLYDTIGIMLMIRVTQQHQEVMAARRIHCLDAYFDKVNMLLWPRFKLVFDLQLSSVRNANPRQLWEDDVRPHYVARRYAEFTASLMHVNVDHADCQLETNLDRLRAAVDTLLVEMSRQFKRQKQRTIFLINNYDLILAVLKEAGVQESKTQRHFEELLTSFTTVFVEEELREYFGGLVDFVRTKAGSGEESSGGSTRAGSAAPGASAAAFAGAAKGAPPLKDVSLAEMESHIKDFAVRWKATVELMHRDVITNFSNFVRGMDILRAALTQLLLYYTRLSDCIKRVPGGAGALAKDVVSIPSIMYEIRKYSLTF